MIHTGEVKTTAPEAFTNETQRKVYAALERLEIPFGRIDNDPAVTMEDCIAIDEALGAPTVKTLLLCNRQQTVFYLYVMPGDKPSSAPRCRSRACPSPPRPCCRNSWARRWARRRP